MSILLYICLLSLVHRKQKPHTRQLLRMWYIVGRGCSHIVHTYISVASPFHLFKFNGAVRIKTSEYFSLHFITFSISQISSYLSWTEILLMCPYCFLTNPSYIVDFQPLVMCSCLVLFPWLYMSIPGLFPYICMFTYQHMLESCCKVFGTKFCYFLWGG